MDIISSKIAAGLDAAHYQKDNASIVSDIQSLNGIRQLARQDKLAAINKAAKEFEGFFLNMMLKSMRAASQVIGRDSPFFSHQQQMYTGLLDEQLANNLSTRGSLGIADLLTRQLAKIEGLAEHSTTSFEHTGDSHTLSKMRGEARSARQTADESIVQTQSKNGQFELPADNEVLKFFMENQAVINSSAQPASIVSTTESPSAMMGMMDKTKSAKTASSPQAKAPATRLTMFESAQEFVEKLAPYAKKAARLLNINPAVVLAQAALETGWGKHVMHDKEGQSGFNLFGIKSSKDWFGKTIELASLEVESGEFKPVISEFRSYQNFAEAFEDYVRFLVSNPRYEPVLSAESPEDYAKALQQSGYATDPHYGDKIMRIFKSDLLQKITTDSD